MKGMSMKDRDAAIAVEWAVKGWTTYVQMTTRDLPADHPVDERMMQALAGEELPSWLEDGIRMRLVAARTQLLSRQASG